VIARIKPQSTARILAWPAGLALASVAGLVSALIGDSVFDAASWLLLGGLIVLILRKFCR
jgi:hypothetical protein